MKFLVLNFGEKTDSGGPWGWSIRLGPFDKVKDVAEGLVDFFRPNDRSLLGGFEVTRVLNRARKSSESGRNALG